MVVEYHLLIEVEKIAIPALPWPSLGQAGQ